jgi:LuxR family transcriptional regulator
MTITSKTDRLSRLCPAGYFIAIRMGFFFPVFETSTLPPAWVTRYTSRGYMVADPVMHWCHRNTGAVRWSEIALDDPRDVMGHARRHGLHFGCAASCTDPDDAGQRSFGTFAHGEREFTAAEMGEIRDLLEDIHIAMVPPRNLTAAELEALRLVKNGLLMKEIANLLGVTESAVKQRLKNAKNKLRAKTSAQAATMATSFGLI